MRREEVVGVGVFRQNSIRILEVRSWIRAQSVPGVWVVVGSRSSVRRGQLSGAQVSLTASPMRLLLMEAQSGEGRVRGGAESGGRPKGA